MFIFYKKIRIYFEKIRDTSEHDLRKNTICFRKVTESFWNLLTHAERLNSSIESEGLSTRPCTQFFIILYSTLLTSGYINPLFEGQFRLWQRKCRVAAPSAFGFQNALCPCVIATTSRHAACSFVCYSMKRQPCASIWTYAEESRWLLLRLDSRQENFSLKNNREKTLVFSISPDI